MSDFDTRPTGTVMYGAFDTFAPAERALRVLKNAGYARATFEASDADEWSSVEPAVVVVDAAAAGARRAVEILEEHGAQIRFAGDHIAPDRAAPEPVLIAETETPLVVVPTETPLVVASADLPLVVVPVERKPRVRRRVRHEAQRAVPPPVVPNDWQDVVIVTRTIDSVLSDGR